MNKEKTTKPDRSRRPLPNTNSGRLRPPSQPPPSQHPNGQPSQVSSAPLFGSLRRFKAGAVTSTPKSPSTFYSDLNRNSPANQISRRVDNNANFTHERDDPRSGRGKENVGNNKDIFRVGRTNISKDKTKTSSLLRAPSRTLGQNQTKPKRPVTVAIPNHVFLRRGHKEGQNHQDNISRTSSITNLDSLDPNLPASQTVKGAKPKKTSSKEKIDKQAQDAKKVTKNNNKLEPALPPSSGPPLSYSADSLQENELHQLRKQLKDMADEKSSLALQLGEQRGQLNVLQNEIIKLKTFQEDSNLEMEKLAEENTALRNRLRDVAHSPLSDNEKQQLLFESRHHSSAPASIATNVLDDNGGDATTCTTPDWDKQSSGNVSEVSVACLQDKINQMQETHYSTNEELQATLQELTDLQRQLTELQQENERLNEEKTLMFDSLCRQTERLNDSRQEVDSLKQLLYRERSDEPGQLESAAEREEKLVDLLRSAQEEREQLLIKLEQVQGELHDSRSNNIEKTDAISQLSERVKTLECTLDAKHAEHKQLDQELAQAKDQCSGKQIEIDRLSDLLENARTKINELEQDRTLSDKSELDELLDNARKEKDQLESEVSYLKEQLARSKNEIEKLKEQVLVLQEECKVTRNNAKSTQSDLEYKCEKLASEKTSLGDQLQQFQEAVNELQVQTQCHIEDKRQLSAVLSETQRNLSETERKNLTLESEIQELKKLRSEENDEWEKFQNDLLTSVRVANDFKTEAQQELQKIILENKTYRERVRLLEGQLEKLKGGTEHTSTPTQTDIILTHQIVSLAKNLDPSIPARLSWLNRASSPTSSMDKLFPSLNKERKAKSKENLAETASESSSKRQHKRQESGERFKFGLKKSKSKDDLAGMGGKEDEGWEKVESEPMTLIEKNNSNEDLERYNKGHKRSKSKESLAGSGDEIEKGSRSFLRWNKSKENLEQLVGSTPKEKNSFSMLKRNKSRENLDQLKTDSLEEKKSTNTLDSLSDSGKSDQKSEFLAKFIKKRDKKPTARLKSAPHQKFMSIEEETLLKSLDMWYGNIDETLPDELLTQEERAVRKLKILFEDEMLKEKPIAHKPKEKLAISKPLLQSVVQNPKLERIFKDPNLPSVEGDVRQSALEEVCSMAGSQTVTNIPKSKSLENINVFEEQRAESELGSLKYRSIEIDSCAQGPYRTVSYNRMSSDILPTDSASNPRFSELPTPNIYVKYENLDEIMQEIPKDTKSKLIEEQRFMLNLKQSLDEREKESAVKDMSTKKKITIRGQEISYPTKESVEKNWKLKEILLNPKIRIAEEKNLDQMEWKQHSTDISSALGSPIRLVHNSKRSSLKATSKSHEDISFSFIPENTLLNMFEMNADKEESESSFTSAEFNLDTGKIVKTFEVTDVKLRTSGDSKEDLLYNETINKAKVKEKRESKQLIEKIINELSKQEEEEDEEIHHPKIIQARERYKRELQLALKRLEHDELRESIRRQRKELEKQSQADGEPNKEEPKYVSATVNKEAEVQSKNTLEGLDIISPPLEFAEANDATNEDTINTSVKNLSETPVEGDTKLPKSEEILTKTQSVTVEYPRETQKDLIKVKEVANLTFAAPESTGAKIEAVNTVLTNSEGFSNISADQKSLRPIAVVDNIPEVHEASVTIEKIGSATLIESERAQSEGETAKSVLTNSEDFSNISADQKSLRPMAVTDYVPEVHEASVTIENIGYATLAESERAQSENETAKPVLTNSEGFSNISADQKSLRPMAVTDHVPEVHEASVTVEKVGTATLVESERAQTEVKTTKSAIIDSEDFANIPADQKSSRLLSIEEDVPVYEASVTVHEVRNTVLVDPERIHSKVNATSPVLEKTEYMSDASVVADEKSLSPKSRAIVDVQEASIIIEEVVDAVLSDVGDKQINAEYSLEAHEPSITPNEISDATFVDAEYSPELPQSSIVTSEDYVIVEYDEGIQTDSDSELSFSSNTLKENRYGVIGTKKVRHNYRSVVKEFKTKFPTEETSETTQKSNSESDSKSYLEYEQSFIDDFFKPVKFFEETVDDSALIADVQPDDESRILYEDKSASMSQIDQDMQDIMDRYLHTRASFLVKSVDNSALKKYDKQENLTIIIDPPGNWQMAQSTVAIEEQTATLADAPIECTVAPKEEEFLSMEDLQFIEEMKQKYAAVDTVSSSSDKSLDNDVQDCLKVPKVKKPRPLSEINEYDLRLIARVSVQDMKSPKTCGSMIPIRKPSSPSLCPNSPQNLPLQTPVSQTYLQAPLREKDSKKQTCQDQTKRLSDLIFNETIFVPISKIPVKAPSGVNSISSPACGNKEIIFVPLRNESPSTSEQDTKISINLNKRSPTTTPSHWSNSLKRGLLDSPTSYEPVYSSHDQNFEERSESTKKPLPAPRYVRPVNKNDGTQSSTMTDPIQNFSAVGHSQPQRLGDATAKVDLGELEAENNAQSQEVISVEKSKAQTNILLTLETRKDETEVAQSCGENSSVIAETDITCGSAVEDDIEEIPREQNIPDNSNLNLFYVDSHSSCDSYLELFQSKESKDFQRLAGQQPPLQRTQVKNSTTIDPENTPSMPKVVDFVPLDNKTTAMLTIGQTSNSYDTLEREKTFHVLGKAANIGSSKSADNIQEKEESSTALPSSVEVLARKSSSFSKASSKSQTSTSFTQAKQIFEALAGANKDGRPKSIVGKASPKDPMRDCSNFEDMKSEAKSE
ncbi:golgin subfamily A member 4-like isoform X2 [Euwallacea similis]|uniref:golgin subfamily A member 4-like isoform X2 n=1 Tax=Euwallacea similis TaxID=1736056 RepID=UPI00344B5052